MVTKYAAGFVPPLLLVAFRFNVGGLLLLVALRLFESELGRKDVLPMLDLGCFGVGVAQTAFTFGVSMTSVASTGLVFATAPVWGWPGASKGARTLYIPIGASFEALPMNLGLAQRYSTARRAGEPL